MGNLRRIGCGFAGALLVALTSAHAFALADEPSAPDPTVMDVVDSVLAGNPPPVAGPPPTAQVSPTAPDTNSQ
ncbi:MAG: hypothetical protein JO330_11315 [Mycobacteriaceae bacterium]|nr:hypothetical protein [Mycobacteriaceae bacterium]